jgi:hypothetical protein
MKVSLRTGSLRRLVVGLVTAALIGTGAVTQAAASPVHLRSRSAATQQAPADFYRLRNLVTGDHFHTSSVDEVVAAIQNDNYVYEGVTAHLPSPDTPGAVPFYRLWNPETGDRFHTTNWDEVIVAIQTYKYRYEGIRAYVYPANSSQGMPFYRLRSKDTGDHFHTTSWTEVMTAIQQYNYLYEGVGANVLP